VTLIRPFRALRPVPTRAREVLAPPYDVLSSMEARVRAKGKPWSFLHVSKAEIDLPEGAEGRQHDGRGHSSSILARHVRPHARARRRGDAGARGPHRIHRRGRRGIRRGRHHDPLVASSERRQL